MARRGLVGALVVASLVSIVPGPSHAQTLCVARRAVAVQAGVPRMTPVGEGVACSPDLGCFNGGCVMTVRLSITGRGIVGGRIVGDGFEPVECLPSAFSCSVETPEFTTPFGGGARCLSTTAVAIDVELACVPTRIR